MHRIVSRTSLAGAAVALMAALNASVLAAQTTYRACRVPDVGAIYMIGVTGTPNACLEGSHVEFSWSEGGPNSVGAAEVVDNSLTAADLATGSVGTAEVVDNSLTANDLAPGSVGTSEVADNTLTAAGLAANSVGSSEVAANSLTANDLASGSVGTAEIGADVVTPAHIAPNRVWDFGGNNGLIRLHGNFTGSAGTILLSSWESTNFNGPQARFDGASGGFWDYGLNGNGDFVIERNDGAACTITQASLNWACASDRNMKENFSEVDGSTVLETLATLPIQSWSFLGAPSVRHVGPVAQDFYEAFGLGDDDTKIGLLDAAGISLLAVQALEARTRELETDNVRLRAEIERLIAAMGRSTSGR